MTSENNGKKSYKSKAFKQQDSKDLAGFLDVLVQIDLANRKTKS